MVRIEYLGSTHYEVTGEREVEAAAELEEGLSAVAKRRSAYVQVQIDAIVEDIVKDYGVEIKLISN